MMPDIMPPSIIHIQMFEQSDIWLAYGNDVPLQVVKKELIKELCTNKEVLYTWSYIMAQYKPEWECQT